MARRKLVVEIIGDSSSLERSFRRGSTAAHQFERNLSGMVRQTTLARGAFAGFTRSIGFMSASLLGTVGLVHGLNESIEAASNLEEQTTKTEVVFGEFATTVENFAKGAAQSFGLAEDQALQFASTFGSFLRPFGVAEQQASALSVTLTKLGADLASFYNTDVQSALEAIQSGLLGQARPLRQYGVALSEARVEAEAFASGLAKPTVSLAKLRLANDAVAIAQAKLREALKDAGPGTAQAVAAQDALVRANLGLKKALAGNRAQLTDQQKVLARYQIIMRDTALAQGDFARTGEGHANTMRRLTAAVRNLEAGIGEALLPTITRLGDALATWISDTENQEAVSEGARKVVHALTETLKTLWGVLTTLAGPASALANSIGGWKTALELAAGAFVGFKVAAISSATAIEVANIAAASGTAAAWRAALVSTGWGVFAAAAGAAAAYVVTHWKETQEFFRKFWIEWQIFADEAVLHVVEIFSHLPSRLGGWARDLKDELKTTLDDLDAQLEDFLIEKHQRATAEAAKGPPGTAGKILGFLDQVKASVDQALAMAQGAQLAAAAAGVKTGGAKGAVAVKTWRDRWQKAYEQLQLTLSQKELTPNLPAQLHALEQIEKAIRAQLVLHKGDLDLQQQLVQVQGQRADLEKQIAKTRADQRKGAQFRGLGLTATGDAAAPSIKQLRAQLGRVDQAIEGTFLDTKRTRTMISRIRKILAGGLGAVGRDVRDAIHRILDDFNQQLKDNQADRTKFRHANTAKILAGLGLSPEQVAAVRARLAQVGAGGSIPGGGSAAFSLAGGVTIGTINVHGVQDARKLEAEIARRARSRPKQRRGV